jgi:hypothetical protein
VNDTNNSLRATELMVIGERHKKRGKDRERDANVCKDVFNTIFRPQIVLSHFLHTFQRFSSRTSIRLLMYLSAAE